MVSVLQGPIWLRYIHWCISLLVLWVGLHFSRVFRVTILFPSMFLRLLLPRHSSDSKNTMSLGSICLTPSPFEDVGRIQRVQLGLDMYYVGRCAREKWAFTYNYACLKVRNGVCCSCRLIIRKDRIGNAKLILVGFHSMSPIGKAFCRLTLTRDFPTEIWRRMLVQILGLVTTATLSCQIQVCLLADYCWLAYRLHGPLADETFRGKQLVSFNRGTGGWVTTSTTRFTAPGIT